MATKKKSRLDIISEEKVKRLPGFVVRRSTTDNEEDSYVIVTLSYRADPDKDSPEWLMRQAARMPDDRSLRREYLLDWASAEGDSFYPNFSNAPERYVSTRRAAFNPKLPVYRGFDFGFRFPACIWMQVYPSGRVAVLRDVLPSDIDTYSFRDLVLFLSGQSLKPGTPYDIESELEFLSRRPRAYTIASKIANEPPWWDPSGTPERYPIPFFPPGTRFINLSGPEALRISPTVQSDSKERTDAEVFASAGIILDMAWQSVNAGETLMRKLLLDMPDKRPRLAVHPSATNFINAMAGGLVYAAPTKASPRPETVKKDGLFEHIHDACRYAITHMIDPDDVLDEVVAQEHFRETSDVIKAREKIKQDDVISDQSCYEMDMDWNDLNSFC